MSRNGLIRLSGNSASFEAASSGVLAVLTVLTTWPRLALLARTRAVTAYQLMSANVTPESLSASHVPPPGSDGASTAQPWMIFSAGGNPATRVSFSSRFIASA